MIFLTATPLVKCHEIPHLKEPLVYSLAFFHFDTEQGGAVKKNHIVFTKKMKSNFRGEGGKQEGATEEKIGKWDRQQCVGEDTKVPYGDKMMQWTVYNHVMIIM